MEFIAEAGRAALGAFNDSASLPAYMLISGALLRRSEEEDDDDEDELTKKKIRRESC
jgi:hypothetical protein|uniref:Uncharacterized protein n=1 Tax=Oryza sativa subsp. japonica TaxID=39947 RepID=Q5Z7E8_ORYSJ|nr:hypothetical protein [Oryza sativa Japonica Group]